jgi:hypothetical protein
MAKDARTAKRTRNKSKADANTASRKRSAAELDKIKRAAEQQIDEFMKTVGDSNPFGRTDEEGWRWFEYRSVRGRAGIVQSDTDGEMYLRAESLVIELPPDQEVDARLMHDLLQTNMTIPGAARLGITDDGVFAIATLPVSGLRAGDVSILIRSVMALAANFVNPPREQVIPEGAGQEPAPVSAAA